MTKTNMGTLEFLQRKYIGDDEATRAEIERERVNARVASQLYAARKRAGLTQQQLAKLVGTTQSVVSRLEDADYGGHTVQMLRKIATALGENLEVVISGDDARAIGAAKGDEEPLADVLNQCPVKEMAQRDWIPGETLPDLTESVRRFLWPFRRPVVAQFRRSGASECNDAALLCWLKKLEIEAERVSVPRFRTARLRAELPQLVGLSAEKDGPAKGVAWLEDRGVHCVFVRHLAQTYLDGAVMLSDDGNPVIGLTLRHDRLDNFWFTLLHEIGHIVRHKGQLATQAIVDRIGQEMDLASEDPIEQQANRFATKAWVSERQWRDFRARCGRFIRKADIAGFARRLGVTAALVAGRLRYELQRYAHYKEFLGQDRVRSVIQEHYPVF